MCQLTTHTHSHTQWDILPGLEKRVLTCNNKNFEDIFLSKSVKKGQILLFYFYEILSMLKLTETGSRMLEASVKGELFNGYNSFCLR